MALSLKQLYYKKESELKELRNRGIIVGFKDGFIHVKIPLIDTITVDEYYFIIDQLYGIGDLITFIDRKRDKVHVKYIALKLPVSYASIKGIDLLAIDLYNNIKKMYSEYRRGGGVLVA